MQNLFKFLILFSFVAGCSNVFYGPAYTTSQGINVYCENESICPKQNEVESAIDLLLADLMHQVPEDYTFSKMSDILESQYGFHKIAFMDADSGTPGSCPTTEDPHRACRGFVCGDLSSSGWCAGLTSRQMVGGQTQITMKLARFSDCISKNALIHELIHFFHILVFDNGDSDHDEEPYWTSSCTEELYPDEESRYLCVSNTINSVVNRQLTKLYCEDTNG